MRYLPLTGDDRSAMLANIDGFKFDGNTWHSVDPDRVRRFMDTVESIRQ